VWVAFMRIDAIVLAAGQSTRMGTNKMLLDVGGETLIERVVNEFLRSQVNRIILVVGFEAERVREVVREKDVRVVCNRHYREGMAASIREGVRHIDPETRGVLIALADHPWLTSETVDQLVDAYRRTEKGIVCPTYGGQRGHPVIFNLEKYGEALRQLEGDIGGRQVVESHQEDLLEIAVDSPSVIRDIDSWKDYEESRE